jgi:hypothetical protein
MSWSMEKAPMLIRSLSRAAAFLAEIVLKNNQFLVTRYLNQHITQGDTHLHSHDDSFGIPLRASLTFGVQNSELSNGQELGIF